MYFWNKPLWTLKWDNHIFKFSEVRATSLCQQRKARWRDLLTDCLHLTSFFFLQSGPWTSREKDRTGVIFNHRSRDSTYSVVESQRPPIIRKKRSLSIMQTDHWLYRLQFSPWMNGNILLLGLLIMRDHSFIPPASFLSTFHTLSARAYRGQWILRLNVPTL